MKDGPDIARIAALIGDPARANMLTALMTGQALTATELAAEAAIGLPTASAHLAKLEAGGLLTMRKQGRHRYFALATDEVAQVLEALVGLAVGSGHLRTRTGPRDVALRRARVCYNHLAGDMGVQLYDSLVARDLLVDRDDRPVLTEAGDAAMDAFGIDLAALRARRAPLCRDCLDWSARRIHLAGSLGRALLTRMEALAWARRDAGSRAILFTSDGARQFARAFPAPARLAPAPRTH